MAWSETMFIIQHFYNVFDVDRRLTDVEYKAPLIARSVNGLPENVEVEDLTPGTLWFIRKGDSLSRVDAVTILDEHGNFAEPIPFSVDLANLSLDETMKQIANSMGLTAQNYYDIIKSMLEILVNVPVERGGTGIQTVAAGEMLMGDTGNKFKKIGLDNVPTQSSENLVNSGALFNQFKKYAEKNHAVENQDYGIGTNSKYGHLRITDDYETLGTDPSHTAVSVQAVSQLLQSLSNFLNLFQVISIDAENDTLYSGSISAFRTDGMNENTLRLIDSYFSIIPNSTGDYTLIIK